MAQTPGDRRGPALGSTAGMQPQRGRPGGAASPRPAAFWSNPTPLSPLGSRLDNLRQTPAQLRMTITRNGRTYKEIDNGIATVLVPTLDPGTSQAEVAANRAAADRAFYMANNPFAGGAYGIAALLGGSPQTRDRAMRAGAVADAALSAYAPRGTPPRRPASPVKPIPIVPLDGRIRLRELNSKGQARGVNASIEAGMLRTGTKANWRNEPPGWQGEGDKYNEARAHLLARQLGGSGKDRRNIVTMTQDPTNASDMGSFEAMVANNVRKGDIVEYSVTPLYGKGALPPAYVLLSAHGLQSGSAARLIRNPAGQPR